MYNILLHVIYIVPSPKAALYRWHPVAWDDMCGVAYPGLDRLLVAFAEYDPVAGRLELNRLMTVELDDGRPTQWWAVLSARTTLLARELAAETRLSRLSEVAAALAEGERGFLAQTADVRRQIEHISRLQIDFENVDRPIFREPAAHVLRTEIENFGLRVAGLHEPLASEFGKAARAWLTVADEQWQQARQALLKEPTPQVFRAGDPVRLSQEAFVFRSRVVGELEQQLSLASGCPGLVLYGRRRLGKSTLLKKLSPFLPDSMYLASMSMQNPALFSSLESWCDAVASSVEQALGPALQDQRPRTLSELFAWLGRIDRSLGDTSGEATISERADTRSDTRSESRGQRVSRSHAGRRLLLAIDEYEVMDRKLGEGVLPEDLLVTIRESIQTHRHITWIFAGSHSVGELTHADWPSYFASVRTLTVPLFTEIETRTLLTNPLKHSPIWERDPDSRPHFEPAFWAGEAGLAAIHAEAAGWPHLVQLIAETAIDRINNEPQKQLDLPLLEVVFDESVQRGEIVLRLLMQQECTLPGEWDYLTGFRRSDTQAPPTNDAIFESLRRRLLIVEDGDQWRLRVPLMQRWLRTV